MADYTRVERVKNALDNRKIQLSAKCPADDSKYSTMMWMLVANNPRLVVWTNDPSDTGEANNYGKIQANLDLPTFVVFLNVLADVIDGANDSKQYVENYNYIFPGGKRSDSPVLISTLYCGKDKDGIVWMSLIAKNRPAIKFVFGEGQFHHFHNKDGSAAEKSKVSQLYAAAHIRILYGFMEQLAVSNYVEPEKKDTDKKGGYNNNKQASKSFESEELPF